MDKINVVQYNIIYSQYLAIVLNKLNRDICKNKPKYNIPFVKQQSNIPKYIYFKAMKRIFNDRKLVLLKVNMSMYLNSYTNIISAN